MQTKFLSNRRKKEEKRKNRGQSKKENGKTKNKRSQKLVEKHHGQKLQLMTFIAEGDTRQQAYPIIHHAKYQLQRKDIGEVTGQQVGMTGNFTAREVFNAQI